MKIKFAMMVKGRDERNKTLVMPLKNGTQKVLKLGPDFRRDDGKGKVRDDGKGSR